MLTIPERKKRSSNIFNAQNIYQITRSRRKNEEHLHTLFTKGYKITSLIYSSYEPEPWNEKVSVTMSD